ncbi:MAG: TatD family hydrolase [Candidatus Omnitrophota bacterium]
MFVDAHCHINALPPVTRQALTPTLTSLGICIDSSINCVTTIESLSLSSQLERVYSSIGFHPFCAQEFSIDILTTYKNFISQNSKIVAIGEIGLDEKAQAPLSQQEAVLREFLRLAKETGLPVIIHNRLSGDGILGILNDFFPSYEKVIFHCFSYDSELLHAVVAKGAYVSFSLNVLRKQTRVLQSLVACPLERMLLETDSPYMKINQQPSTPFDIKTLYEFVASLRKIDREEFARNILLNAKKFFSL